MNRNLTVGYYVPTEAFRAVPEMVAVMDAETCALVATCGPAHPASAETQADARLFAVAPQLAEAWQDWLSAARIIEDAGRCDNYTDAARARTRQHQAQERARRLLARARGCGAEGCAALADFELVIDGRLVYRCGPHSQPVPDAASVLCLREFGPPGPAEGRSFYCPRGAKEAEEARWDRELHDDIQSPPIE